MRGSILLAGFSLGALAMGCQAVIGLRDYVVGETGGTGGTTTTTGGGGTGGTGGVTGGTGGVTGGTGGVTGGTGGVTGGTGGTGGTPLACAAAGPALDLFPADASATAGDRMFVVSEATGQSQAAHAVHAYQSGTDLHVDAVSVVAGAVSPRVLWSTPVEAWDIQRITARTLNVSALGYVKAPATIPVIGQVRFDVNGAMQVTDTTPPSLNPLPSPTADAGPTTCAEIATATIDGIAFAESDSDFAVTYDGCVAGRRYLYTHVPGPGLALLESDTLVHLWRYSRNPPNDAIVSADAAETRVAAGFTPFMSYKVSVEDPSTSTTTLQAIVPVPQGFATWWLVQHPGGGASLYSRVVAGNALGTLAVMGPEFTKLKDYASAGETSVWSLPSIGADTVAVASIPGAGDEVRLSILGKDGSAMLLDLPVATGQGGQFLRASVAHYGGEYLVSWIERTGSTFYRARPFHCE